MLLEIFTAFWLASHAAVPVTPTPDVHYGYCKASEPDYGRYHLFSTVFQVPYGTYHVGVQNDFYTFAEAWDGRRFGTVTCGVSYESWQQAENDKNQWMTRHRRDGQDVAIARWRYRGD